jgi:hypothetical protein
MRVGANARQYAQIKKMHADGVSPHIMAKTFRMEPQSLEKILANLDGREERILELDENPMVKAISAENAALREKLAAFEEDDDED